MTDDRRGGGQSRPRKPAGKSAGSRPANRPSGGGSSKPRGGKPSGAGGRDSKPRGGKPTGAGGRDDRGRTGTRDGSGYAGRERGRLDDGAERDTSNDLPWPEEIFDLELEPDLLAEIESFGGRTGTFVKHLLSVQVLAESDPEMAYQHAARVRDRVSRSALARQTACIAAYRTGRFKEAIKEESAYRRLSGNLDLIPIAVDCERGLGRTQRALALVSEFEGAKLDSDTRTELLIVAGGARRDLGDDDAARVFLQKAVRTARSPMAVARSRFALGDLLVALGQGEQARKWLQSAVDVDEDSEWTDAAELLESLG